RVASNAGNLIGGPIGNEFTKAVRSLIGYSQPDPASERILNSKDLFGRGFAQNDKPSTRRTGVEATAKKDRYSQSFKVAGLNIGVVQYRLRAGGRSLFFANRHGGCSKTYGDGRPAAGQLSRTGECRQASLHLGD